MVEGRAARRPLRIGETNHRPPPVMEGTRTSAASWDHVGKVAGDLMIGRATLSSQGATKESVDQACREC